MILFEEACTFLVWNDPFFEGCEKPFFNAHFSQGLTWAETNLSKIMLLASLKSQKLLVPLYAVLSGLNSYLVYPGLRSLSLAPTWAVLLWPFRP